VYVRNIASCEARSDLTLPGCTAVLQLCHMTGKLTECYCSEHTMVTWVGGTLQAPVVEYDLLGWLLVEDEQED